MPKKYIDVAICYDFDMTLSPKNMQEFGFFKALNTTADDFWCGQNDFIEKHTADRMLVNMYGMIKAAGDAGIKFSKENLMNLIQKTTEYLEEESN